MSSSSSLSSSRSESPSEDNQKKMMIITQNKSSSVTTSIGEPPKKIVSDTITENIDNISTRQQEPLTSLPSSTSTITTNNKEEKHFNASSVINTSTTPITETTRHKSSSSSFTLTNTNNNASTMKTTSENLESLLSDVTLDDVLNNSSVGTILPRQNNKSKLETKIQQTTPFFHLSNNNDNDSNSNSTQESNLEDLNEESLMPTANATVSATLMTTPAEDPLKSETNTTTSTSTTTSDLSSQEYHLKWIKWKGNAQQKVPIVTQNSNGSCPLLAIINVLLLRKNICFPPIIEIVTASQLMDYLCDCILTYVPKNLPEQIKLNYEQNLQDAMSIMPRLQTGLDVNVKFTGTMDFEYTPECIIFDLLRIPLYHGWLVDPTHKEICRIVNNQSYNQLVDRIIASKTSSSNDSKMFLAEEFLNQTASQLTNYGLSQLIKHIKEEELCILFRNNHFITLYKHKGKLYQLVTDQGFLTEPNVVWESLNNIEGDTYFVDGDFVLVPPKPSLTLQPTPNLNTQQQIDQDYLIALSLEQEQNYEVERQARSSTDQQTESDESSLVKKERTSSMILMSDEELARKLQEEENQYYEQFQHQKKEQQLQQQKHLQRQQSEVSTTMSKSYTPVPSAQQQSKKLFQIDSGPQKSVQGNCLMNDSNNRWQQQQQYSCSLTSKNSTPVINTIQQPTASKITPTSQQHHHPSQHQASRSSTTTQQPSTSGASSTHRSYSSHSHSHHHLPHSHHSSYSHHQQSTTSEPGSSSVPTASNEPDDLESVSSRRSNNKNSCAIS